MSKANYQTRSLPDGEWEDQFPIDPLQALLDEGHTVILNGKVEWRRKPVDEDLIDAIRIVGITTYARAEAVYAMLRDRGYAV